ncbi:ABC transporter ATP-binding protein [Nitratireductor sp. StC3]|uniref:ABC transporter ATP-binding protein n=1 Tax=Nitratireductor sp. StC3 TaxID=2126741 RepID=UPI000D0DD723|nr:ABC transporter ATP-binding protein [Nitratireductor sp. StC3]PSM18838.1 ABC transporter ATP-binding protein [Nitratireductor sp. StC3]
MSANKDLLRVENLSISIAIQDTSLEVVKNASFRIPAGKTVALVGESGSGKSIIAQSILGILPRVARITGGHIRFRDPLRPDDECDIAALDADSAEMRALRGGRIAIVFQEPMTSLSPLHKVGHQVEEALVLHRQIAGTEARATTQEMLHLVGFPDPERAYDMYPMELSGGLRQRAMIAMALICRPALLIADEPTTALDVTVQAQVLGLLKSLQAKLGMSLLLITHDLGVVANMADEVVVIYHGEVVEAGPLEAIFKAPGHAYTRALMKAVPDLDMDRNQKLVALRDSTPVIPSSMKGQTRDFSRIDGPLLRVRNLSKSYVGKAGRWFGGASTRTLAVDDVSFDVMPGECFGIVGESGCGKSTISKLIMRAIEADSGTIRFDNGTDACDVLDLEGHALKAFRKRIQIVFQDPFGSLSPRSTILNTLSEPLEIHGVASGKANSRNAAELMALVGLQTSQLNRYPHSFSGGQRQRIGIARALALSPDLLICDEPVSALDVSVQAQILNLLKDLQKNLGLTMIFISHNLAVVKYIADRIAVMRRGRIVEVADVETLFARPVHPYTKSLLAAVPTIRLDRKLDFSHHDGDTHDPARDWPDEFKPGVNGDPLRLVPVAEDHWVLARSLPSRERIPA